jgi:FMN phosphatase YigB (HAD superfamily)
VAQSDAGRQGVQLMDDVVFLVDVDNTLLDNDQVIADLRARIEKEYGAESSLRYWDIIEELRSELGYVDYLGALQRYRAELPHTNQASRELMLISGFLIDYPFADRLYPGALDVVAKLRSLGRTVIMSDGDMVFQPRKVRQSGIWKAVDGEVLIFVHKEEKLDEMQSFYPARRYVMVDDKQRILTAMKAQMGDRLLTVFPRQGHYALDPADVGRYPPADVTIERIGDLLSMDIAALLSAPVPTATS